MLIRSKYRLTFMVIFAKAEDGVREDNSIWLSAVAADLLNPTPYGLVSDIRQHLPKNEKAP